MADYKARGKSDQQRRREELLQKQKTKRQDTLENMRKVVKESDEEEIVEKNKIEHDGMEIAKQSRSEEKRIKFWSKQLMLPEMMQDIPEDLISGWLAVPFPAQSKRCIVVSSAGKTISRLDNGVILHTFSSNLPNGSRGQMGTKNACILDCTFHEPTQTYFVLDIMLWNGNSYYECSTDFR
eukprot:TRINITY_DN2150_c0_g1_i1.p1 TRINITY_DN2150_c0_g1~~TRINITY_DN2150_c0_g1_i1.p1  ORF type:complete len:206 (-),score=41.72 TRINITY_DN2150_c0_g1_i1:341-883(-)